MIDLDKIIHFSCPDECGQIAVSCSLRMILNNETFFCEACGCEFHGEDCPEWLWHAALKSGFNIDNMNLDDIIKTFDETFDDAMTLDDTLAAMISLYSYFYNKGDCPSEEIRAQLLRADCSLWKLFPAEKNLLPKVKTIQMTSILIKYSMRHLMR